MLFDYLIEFRRPVSRKKSSPHPVPGAFHGFPNVFPAYILAVLKSSLSLGQVHFQVLDSGDRPQRFGHRHHAMLAAHSLDFDLFHIRFSFDPRYFFLSPRSFSLPILPAGIGILPQPVIETRRAFFPQSLFLFKRV
jgi:hypothetical protein